MKNNLQLVIPLAGGNQFFDSDEYIYPKPIIEINEKPVIQWVVENYAPILSENTKIIFIVKESECSKFNLDYTLKILCPQCKIVKLRKDTKGAVCTVLMAIDELDMNAPLIIANGDQVIDADMQQVIKFFEEKKADAGVLCFNSVHPKWSYIRPGENNEVLETAEKKPISNKAIAGFYYFKKATDFIAAASKAIINDRSLNGIFFVSYLMNEMILLNKKVYHFDIETERYHSFYSPSKIEEFVKKYAI